MRVALIRIRNRLRQQDKAIHTKEVTIESSAFHQSTQLLQDPIEELNQRREEIKAVIIDKEPVREAIVDTELLVVVNEFIYQWGEF